MHVKGDRGSLSASMRPIIWNDAGNLEAARSGLLPSVTILVFLSAEMGKTMRKKISHFFFQSKVNTFLQNLAASLAILMAVFQFF